MSLTAAPSAWGCWSHVCNSTRPVPCRAELLSERPPDSGPLTLTFQPLLPQRHHLIKLPLDQPVGLLLVQPVAAGERLLDASEGAQDHHLGRQTARVSRVRLTDGTPRSAQRPRQYPAHRCLCRTFRETRFSLCLSHRVNRVHLFQDSFSSQIKKKYFLNYFKEKSSAVAVICPPVH